MKLSGLNQLSLPGAKIEYALLTEAQGRTQIQTFDYPNYNLDPRPTVLVLGYWNHPSTGNRLLGGINLNYITGPELARVQQAIPTIMRAKNLKARYWKGRQLLPDIFTEFYRTYDTQHVNGVTPSELEAVSKPEQTKDGLNVTKIKKAIELLRSKNGQSDEPTQDQKSTTPPTPATAAADAATPASISKIVPDQQKQQNLPWRAAAKLASIQAQKTKKELDQTTLKRQQAAKTAVPKQFQKSQVRKQEPKRQEIDDEISGVLDGRKDQSDSTADELSKPPQFESAWRHPFLGFVWPSPMVYREWHRPAAFLTTKALSESHGKPLLAVYDVKTGETLIDWADDHGAILQEAGWDYWHTIRLMPVAGKVIPIHDGLTEGVVRYAMRRIPPIVFERLV